MLSLIICEGLTLHTPIALSAMGLTNLQGWVDPVATLAGKDNPANAGDWPQSTILVKAISQTKPS